MKNNIQLNNILEQLQKLPNEQIIDVRASWCYGILAKLSRSNIDNKEELMNIVLEAISSKESKDPKALPSLYVPSYFLMSVENTKNLINIFGTTNFGFSSMYIYEYTYEEHVSSPTNNPIKATSPKIRVRVNSKREIM